MGSSRPILGCAAVNTELVPGCSSKGKTIAITLAMVFFILHAPQYREVEA
jgi:hypothetical protein